MNMPATKVQSLSSSLAKKLELSIDGKDLIETLRDTAFRAKEPVSDSQMSALLIIAGQYGLNPWTKEIYAYPDKQNGIVPVVGVDGWTRIINEHPSLDGIEFNYSEGVVQHKGKVAHEWIECVIHRSDRKQPIVVREYFDEVCRTVNFPTPWDSHPKRMHRHKALIQCSRIAFGFAGIYDEDEADRIMEKDVTARGESTVMPRETEPEPLPEYPEAAFRKNYPKWRQAIESGTKTHDDWINTLKVKGELNEGQLARIHEVQAPIEGEVTN